MIRRRLGDRFLLFTQHDHAQLSGALARHYGNDRFAVPEPREETIAAVGLHDGGWPLHDDSPTLDKGRFPLDVFDSPLALALRMWRAAADRAAAEADYTQLLVSLHGLGLSGFAATHVHSRHEVFELNKFQQREVERQEILRQKLGLATDLPLRLGLAEANASPAEAELRRNHFVLQAMDRLSLALCCTEVVFPKIDDILPRPGARPVSLAFARTGDFSVSVNPWPFDAPSISHSIPCRSLPATPFADETDFKRAYAAAPVEEVSMTVHSPR